ncbi:MAG: DUF3808 domain-containing protein [bacterium]|nr:DUF3808 domain-containing protein [bacterium]
MTAIEIGKLFITPLISIVKWMRSITAESTIISDSLSNVEDHEIREQLRKFMQKSSLLDLCTNNSKRSSMIDEFKAVLTNHTDTAITNAVDSFYENMIDGISKYDDLSRKYQNRVAWQNERTKNKPGLYVNIIQIDETIIELEDAYKAIIDTANKFESSKDFKQYIEYIERSYLNIRGVEKQKHYPIILNNIAKAYMELDEIEKPLFYLIKANKIDQSNKQIRANLAIAYANNENYDEANKLLNDLEGEQQPHIQVQILNIKSLTCLYESEFDKALILNESALKFEPENIYLNANRGLILCYHGKFEMGIRLLDDTSKKSPNDIIVNRTLAFCLMQHHLFLTSEKSQPMDERTTIYFQTKILGAPHKFKESVEVKGAIALFEKASRLKIKRDEPLILNLATCYFNDNQFDKVITTLDEINYKQATAHLKYIILNTKGMAYVLMNKYEEAIELFSKMVDLEPKSPMPYIYLGQSYAALLKNDLALQYFITADELKQNDPHIKLNIGLSYARKGNNKEALNAYESAIAAGMVNDPILYFQKGLVEHNLGYYASAYVSLQKARELKYQDDSRLPILLATCYLHCSLWKDALSALDEVLSTTPDDLGVKSNKAIVLFNLGDYNGAMKIADYLINTGSNEHIKIAEEIKMYIEMRTTKIIKLKVF